MEENLNEFIEEDETVEISKDELGELQKAKEELDAIKRGENKKEQTQQLSQAFNPYMIIQVKGSGGGLRYFQSFLYESMREGKLVTLWSSTQKESRAEKDLRYKKYQTFRIIVPQKILNAMTEGTFQFTRLEDVQKEMQASEFR